ncbi:WcaF family extracellular polysaccharide biosynthesis acetyltransferase [Shewanella baltica]|uniref:WcaF family extracellular polysaccharide biosynthesis acetyltransferase n=1 Tax=Shewanella baltica TaxID=62322 RepID=UPI003D79E8B3
MLVRLKDYNNSWFIPGPLYLRVLWGLASYLFFRTILPFPSSFKVFILKMFGARVGCSVVIKPHVNIKYPWNLEIGDHSWIGEGVWIDNLAKVSIGNNCCLSQDAYLLTGNHNYKSPTFDLLISKIILNEGSWIGAKSTVCPGVTVMEYAVLTAGSIATNDLVEFGIYQGNPAKKIKERIIQ